MNSEVPKNKGWTSFDDSPVHLQSSGPGIILKTAVLLSNACKSFIDVSASKLSPPRYLN